MIYRALLLVLLVSGITFPQEDAWMPLSLGNVWQYESYWDSYGTDYYSILIITSSQSKSFNNRYYFRELPINYNYYAYDPTTSILYEQRDNQEEVYLDFSLPGETILADSSSPGYSKLQKTVEGRIEVFGDSTDYKGLYQSIQTESGSSTGAYYFVQGVGLCYRSLNSRVYGSELGSRRSSLKLKQALIRNNDGTYTHYKANDVRTVFKDFQTSDHFNNSINISVELKNDFANIQRDQQGYSFIHEFNAQYFYVKGDTLLIKDPVELEISKFESEVNTKLSFEDKISDGYTMGIRFFAVDMSIIPDTVYYPENGYFAYDGDTLTETEFEDPPDDIPVTGNYALAQNYPNPFNPSTRISFFIPRAERVSIKVYDTIGREVAELINREISRGIHSLNFDAGDLSSGIYFYSIKAGSYTQTKKMILMR